MADMFNMKDHRPRSLMWGKYGTKLTNQEEKLLPTQWTGNPEIFNNKLYNTCYPRFLIWLASILM